MDRALVTGGTGFVGGRLVATLLARGVETHVVVRETTPPERRARLGPVAGVVVDDGRVDTLAEAVARIRPDVTFHLATHFVAQHTPDDIVPLVAANLSLPLRLAEALTAGGATRLVNTGTVWQHVENAPYRPKGVYAATKQAAEDLLRAYAELELLSVCTLVLTDAYGPGDPRPKLLPTLLRVAREGGPPLAMGSGRPYVDLVHVDDVVAAFLAVAAAGTDRWERYGVGSGAPVTVRALVALVEEVLGVPVPVDWDARPDRPLEMLTPWSPGPAPPGWSPAVGLRDGIADLARG